MGCDCPTVPRQVRPISPAAEHQHPAGVMVTRPVEYGALAWWGRSTRGMGFLTRPPSKRGAANRGKHQGNKGRWHSGPHRVRGPASHLAPVGGDRRRESMTNNKSRMVAAGSVFTLVAAAVGISIIGGGAADAQEAANTVPTAFVAANSVNSASIVNGGIYQADINTGVVNVLRTPGKDSVTGWTVKDGTVIENDLSTAVKAKLNDKSGQFTGLESDSPYPGATKLQDNEGQGANSTEKWIGDGGKTLQTSWVQCADG